MLRPCAPTAAMTVRPSATTRSRVSTRRLVLASPGGLNQSASASASAGGRPAIPASTLCLHTGAAFDSEQSSLYCVQCSSELNSVHVTVFFRVAGPVAWPDARGNGLKVTTARNEVVVTG